MARTYAKVVGIAVFLTGVVGLLAGEEDLLGLLNIDLVEDIIHLTTGGLLAYVGFAGSESTVRTVVGTLGVVYLLVGILGFVIPTLFGLLPHELNLPDHILHLALGIIGLLTVTMDKGRPVTT